MPVAPYAKLELCHFKNRPRVRKKQMDEDQSNIQWSITPTVREWWNSSREAPNLLATVKKIYKKNSTVILH